MGVTYQQKFKALDDFVKRGMSDFYAIYLANWIKHREEILERCKFVTSAMYAPDVLVISERMYPSVGCVLGFSGNKELIGKLEEGITPRDDEWEKVLKDFAESSLYECGPITRELKQFNGTLYVKLDVDTRYPPTENMLSVIEENEWLIRFERAMENLESLSEKRLEEVVDAEINIAILKGEIDKALEVRDRQLFRELRLDLLKADEITHNSDVFSASVSKDITRK